ncbi:MAG TPA: hypothetical protein VNV85_14720 [Puia sp.]|nr:hypothetical protein [Puia sp.]
MIINIINLPDRRDRLKILEKELKEQHITEYKIWAGIIDGQDNTARGISKAHKQIVKYAKDNNLSEILIAADDVKFTAHGAFDFFLQNKLQDFEIYLASIYHGLINADNTVADFSGLTLYIVKDKFYDIFLEAGEDEDLDRSLKNKGRFIVSNPFTAIQHNGYSDHLKKYCNYDSYLKERKLFEK